MPQEFAVAPEVRAIADRLIDEYHSHLRGQPIRYLFREKAAKEKGRTIWGKARLVTGLNAFLANRQQEGEPTPFFIIEIARDVWVGLKDSQRIALVDHELAHCGLDENGGLCLWPHDLEEFAAIVQRHGLWKSDVEIFANVVRGQLTMPLDDMEVTVRMAREATQERELVTTG